MAATAMTLDQQAQALYEDPRGSVRPPWGSLSQATQDVWVGYVLAGMKGGVLLA